MADQVPDVAAEIDLNDDPKEEKRKYDDDLFFSTTSDLPSSNNADEVSFFNFNLLLFFYLSLKFEIFI